MSIYIVKNGKTKKVSKNNEWKKVAVLADGGANGTEISYPDEAKELLITIYGTWADSRVINLNEMEDRKKVSAYYQLGKYITSTNSWLGQINVMRNYNNTNKIRFDNWHKNGTMQNTLCAWSVYYR